MKSNSLNIWHKINPVLGFIAMFVTQDVVLRFFFRKKKILKNGFSIPINSSIILAPTHRSRWDGLLLTMAMGRRVTKKDCRFMVTKSEMRGIQGWFLKRLGCFSINQLSPSLSALRYAINLIEKGEQLVVFPEGKINRYGKKLVLKEGLCRLARLATKKTTSITIIPIGIAYSKIPPNFRGEFCLSFGKPIPIKDYSNFSIEKLKIPSIIIFALGLYLINNITSDYVETCSNKISYKSSFISKFLGKKNWEISWKDIKLIKSLPTSQGSKVYYFNTFQGDNFLVPQRLEKFEKFLLIVSSNTGIDINEISYISPLWTYKLLTLLSVLMIIGELFAFLN